MEFRRAIRVLAARWWLIALAGMVGVGLAIGAAYFYNSRIEPRYEAQATVEYLRLGSEEDADFEGRLAQARSIATIVLDDGSQDVDTDPAGGRVDLLGDRR